MATNRLIYLFVRFDKKEYLDELRRTGRLRMRRLAAFQQMEDQVGRGDRDDGLSAIYQPDQVKVRWGDIELTDVVGPIKVAHNDTALHHVFCVHAVTSDRITAVLEHGEPMISPQNFGLGDYALVFTDHSEFIRRIAVAAEQLRLSWTAGLVKYVDPNTHNGSVDALTKFDSYSYQCEWRLILPPSGDEIFWFSVGSLEDITMVVPVSELSTMSFRERREEIPQNSEAQASPQQ